MASILSVVLLFIAGLSCSTVNASSRIFGGDTTTIDRFPSIVQVESTTTGLSWSQSCAGTILNSRYILSAVQCFSGALYSNSRRRIRAGSARRGSGGVVIAVNRVTHHQTYSSNTNEGDLTVVELAAAWVFTVNIQPAQIVPQGFDLPDHLPVILAGWGKTRNGLLGGSSSTLRKVTLKKENLKLCAETYANLSSPRVVTENMLCTTSGLDEDSCDGDEGGPVFFQDANGDMFLVGVISWRHSCANPNIPSVNTRVASYTNWIVVNAA